MVVRKGSLNGHFMGVKGLRIQSVQSQSHKAYTTSSRDRVASMALAALGGEFEGNSLRAVDRIQRERRHVYGSGPHIGT